MSLLKEDFFVKKLNTFLPALLRRKDPRLWFSERSAQEFWSVCSLHTSLGLCVLYHSAKSSLPTPVVTLFLSFVQRISKDVE